MAIGNTVLKIGKLELTLKGLIQLTILISILASIVMVFLWVILNVGYDPQGGGFYVKPNEHVKIEIKKSEVRP